MNRLNTLWTLSMKRLKREKATERILEKFSVSVQTHPKHHNTLFYVSVANVMPAIAAEFSFLKSHYFNDFFFNF